MNHTDAVWVPTVLEKAISFVALLLDISETYLVNCSFFAIAKESCTFSRTFFVHMFLSFTLSGGLQLLQWVWLYIV